MDLKSASLLAVKIDTMLLAHDDSHEIVSKLKCLSKEDLIEVLRNCFCLSMLFSLDFVLTCQDEDQDWLFSIPVANKRNSEITTELALLLWQVNTSQSGKADKLKFKLRDKKDKILSDAVVTHPYKYGRDIFVREFDEVCSKLCAKNCFCDIVDVLSKLDIQRLESLISDVLHYSLFKHRLMQYDVFEKMSATQQFIMLLEIAKAQNSADHCNALSFLLQLVHHSGNVAIKTKAKNLLDVKTPQLSFWQDIDESIINCIEESSSFAEFSIKQLVAGNGYASRLVVAHMLLRHSIWLRDWIEADAEEVKSLLDCRDMLA